MSQHKIKSESSQGKQIQQAEFHSALTRKKTLHDTCNTTYSRGKELVQSSLLVCKVLRVQ